MKKFWKPLFLASLAFATAAQAMDMKLVYSKKLSPSAVTSYDDGSGPGLIQQTIQPNGGVRYEGRPRPPRYLPAFPLLEYDIDELLPKEVTEQLSIEIMNGARYTLRILFSGLGGVQPMTGFTDNVATMHLRVHFGCTFDLEDKYSPDGRESHIGDLKKYPLPWHKDLKSVEYTPFSYYLDKELYFFSESVNCNDPGGVTNPLWLSASIRAPAIQVDNFNIEIFQVFP